MGLLCLLWLWPASAFTSAFELQLARSQGLVDLGAKLLPVQLPLDHVLDPDALWHKAHAMPAPEAAANAPPWRVLPGMRSVAAFTLRADASMQRYLIELPIVRVDEVRLYWRSPGQPWRLALAGDTVAQSRWPFAGQFPAFPIDFSGQQPVHVVLAIANSGRLLAPLWLMPDPLYHERRLLQANLSGLMMGMGFTVMLICALTTWSQRRRDVVALTAFSAAAWLTVLFVNGYAAIWLTPEWPQFNDLCKHFIAVTVGSLLLALTVWSQDPRNLARWQQYLPWGVLVLGLALAVSQAFFWPYSWREITVYSWFLLCGLASLLVCLQSYLLGSRHVHWHLLAVLSFGAAVSVNVLPRGVWFDLDLLSAAVAVGMAVSALLFRQGMLVLHQHGRDVLGRDQLPRDRDPLTALLSLDGFSYRFDEHLLRQQATGKAGWMGLIELRGLEAAVTDYGMVQAEQLIVRTAVVLQREMGRKWLIGRISDQRFAVLSIDNDSDEALRAQFTSVLATALRYPEPAGWVEKIDLRIACVQRQFKSTELQPMIDALGLVIAQIRDNRRIVTL